MRILIISILALTGLRSIAPAAEHVVASDADFIAVQEQVQPGDIVRIQPGDYGELSWTASGAPGNPIRVLGIEAEAYAKKDPTLERRFKSLAFGGSHTIISGLRFVGGKSEKGKSIYCACLITGQFVRLTNASFAGCVSRTFCSTGKGSYEVEIDHCDFSGKDPEHNGGGQTMRLFTGDTAYPAGHVIHHNQFGPQATWIRKNGGETIQPFSAGGTNPNRLGEYTYEEDFLIMCNLITRAASENETLSIKCDSIFFLLNTVRRGKETNLRLGRNHTIEGNFFVGSSRAPRSCGANNLFRNNYMQHGSASFKLWGESKGYSGVKDNWIVNNTFVSSAPYTAQGTIGAVDLVNNFMGNGFSPGEKDRSWKRSGNVAAHPQLQEGKEGKPQPQLDGVDRQPFDQLMELDRSMPCRYKRGSEYIEAGEEDAFLHKLTEDSALRGTARSHPFAGGLDPRGNPVPASGANIGALQDGDYNLFKPLDLGDRGPFTAVGQAPQMRITAPREGTTFSGRVEVSVEASDPEGQLAYVYLMLNNQPVSVDTEAPFTWTLDDILLHHANRIRAVAFDRDGNIAYHRVNVINTAPSTWTRNTKLRDYPTVSTPHKSK